MNKKWFPGWGMMRFWETGTFAGSANHTFAAGKDGEGEQADFPGAVKSESLRFPIRDTVLRLSMSPRRAGSFH